MGGNGVKVSAANQAMQSLNLLASSALGSAETATWMKVLLSRNMAAVTYHAIFESQNRYWPISHTSRNSGCRRQNCLISIRRKSLPDREWHVPNDQRRVLNSRGNEHGQNQTRDQTQNGIGPRERHDRQADVLGEKQGGSLSGTVSNRHPAPARKLHTFCQLQVRYLMEFSASSWICLPTRSDSESERSSLRPSRSASLGFTVKRPKVRSGPEVSTGAISTSGRTTNGVGW